MAPIHIVWYTSTLKGYLQTNATFTCDGFCVKASKQVHIEYIAYYIALIEVVVVGFFLYFVYGGFFLGRMIIHIKQYK